MRHNEHAPATRKDVQQLLWEIGRLYVANREWKDEIVREVRGAGDHVRPAAPEQSPPS